MMRLTLRKDGLAGAFIILMGLMAAVELSTINLPLIALLTYAAVIAVPALDPRRAADQVFRDSIAGLATVLVGGLFVMHVFQVAGLFGQQADRQMLTALMVGTTSIVAGNYLPKLRSNWFFGVRTPWTLTSEASWQRTHRLAGWLLIAGGVVILIAAFLRPSLTRTTMFGTLFVTALLSTIYSYFAWRADPRRVRGEETQ